MTITNPNPSHLPPPVRMKEPGVVEGLVLACACGVAYLGTFYLNAHVLQAPDVFAGVALFYLPAGVKLIAIMVCRYWGALGLWTANFLHTFTGWEGLALIEAFWMSVVWVGTTLMVVLMWAKYMGLREDLKNLTFSNFVWLNLIAALLHGIAFNLYMVVIDAREVNEWLSSAKAMALGDFLGSGVLMLLIVSLYKATRWLHR